MHSQRFLIPFLVSLGFLVGAEAQAPQGGIVGGALVEPREEEAPAPPPALEPIAAPERESDGRPDGPSRSDPLRPLVPRVETKPLKEAPPRALVPNPNTGRRTTTTRAASSASRIRVEHQPVGGTYHPDTSGSRILQAGERLRFKYARDTDWRSLEAYGPTDVKFSDHHYEIEGICFHTFKDGAHRVSAPTPTKAREIAASRATAGVRPFRFYVAVDKSAPKAPRPEGGCMVWQNDRLWLNDIVSGSVDTAALGANVDTVGVESLEPGVIFVIEPPSKIILYAVRIDFEEQIFGHIGREKGRCDAELAELGRLSQVADTEARRLWLGARAAYEQERGAYLEEQNTMYQYFLRDQVDSFNLIRAGHPKPHVQLAKTSFRHENLELRVDMFSDHQGQVLFPARAFLWVNDALPLSGSVFDFQILDKSDPSFVGFDTRFSSDGTNLSAQERAKGSPSWRNREVEIDTYTYLHFKPPVPGGSPEYLLDVTTDITGNLKHLDQEMIVNARLGTMRLTPNFLRVELRPELLISPTPMTKIFRDIMVLPMDIRGWIYGRRTRIHQLFDRARLLPDAVLDVFENAADELAMRMWQTETERRTREVGWKFVPANAILQIAKGNAGTFTLEMLLETEDGANVKVTRTLTPGMDLIDFAARSVAANRENVYFHQFRPLTESEWRGF